MGDGDESDLGGTVEYHEGDATITVNGQEVEGYNLLVYTPPTDEIDVTDEFEIEYCAPNGSCQVVKLYIDIIDVPASASSDSLCVARCVWPGDANGDGKVDMVDVLPVGFCTGVVGPTRTDASTDWYGQYSVDWTGPMGAIEKHVDTDGDGEIRGLDTTSIYQHYGKINNIIATPPATLEGIPLYFIPNNPNPQPGDLVTIDVMLGTPGTPAKDIYGLTFSLGYNSEIVVEGSMNVTFHDDSWMSYNSPMLSFVKDRYSQNALDVAYTRTSDVSAHGQGIVATVSFIIIETIDLRLDEDFLPIDLFFNRSPVTMNGAGQYVTIQGADLRMNIDTRKNLLDSDVSLVAYPNPTDQQVNIHLNGGDELEQVKVFTLTGQQVYDSGRLSEGNQLQVDVSGFHNGMYIINAFTSREMISTKVQVEHK